MTTPDATTAERDDALLRADRAEGRVAELEQTVQELAEIVSQVKSGERGVRRRISEEILSLRLDPGKSTVPHCTGEYNAGLNNAARIARGEEASNG